MFTSPGWNYSPSDAYQLLGNFLQDNVPCPREGRQSSWEMSTKNKSTLEWSPQGDMTWDAVWFGAFQSNHCRSMLMLVRFSSQRLGETLWLRAVCAKAWCYWCPAPISTYVCWAGEGI